MTDKQLLDMFNSGLNIREIVQRTKDTDSPYVRRRLLLMGVKFNHTRQSKYVSDLIPELHKEGIPVSGIAERLNLTDQTIKRHLINNGVDPRSLYRNGPPKPWEPSERYNRMWTAHYVGNETYEVICKREGVSRQRVQQIVKKTDSFMKG